MSVYKSKSNKRGNNNRYKDRKKSDAEDLSIVRAVPIIIAVAILPLIVGIGTYKSKMASFSWYPSLDKESDVFLYNKYIFFIMLTAIIAIILLYQGYKKQLDWRKNIVFIPILFYIALITLSTILSEYKLFAINGSREQFETIFVLLGYCFIAFYGANNLTRDSEFLAIVKCLIASVLILSILGFTQFIGHDFFATEIGKSIITLGNKVNDITFEFEKGRVYLTLYNPNYVGVYVALIAPIIFVMLSLSKTWKERTFFVVALLGLIVCAVGSVSLSGIIALCVSFIAILLLLRKYIVKQFKIVIPIIVLSLLSIFIINTMNNNIIFERLKNLKNLQKDEHQLEAIYTNNDNVEIRYKDNTLKIQFAINNENGTINFNFLDENNGIIESQYDAEQNKFLLLKEQFTNITVTPMIYENYYCFNVMIDGVEWMFTNQAEDGTYYYINRFGKLDKIAQPESLFFTGYEHLISNRGYIWSRTIPMLKNNIIIGSGPDSYIMTFPQQDYVGLYNAGMHYGILSKPHSLYLQIWTQTGLLSLLAFIVFYGMYFFMSIKLYFKSSFDHYSEKLGVAILCGTIGYMVTGLTNDSNLATAPIFWALMGVGIAVNRKVKAYN